jgi:hypothetical protein
MTSVSAAPHPRSPEQYGAQDHRVSSGHGRPLGGGAELRPQPARPARSAVAAAPVGDDSGRTSGVAGSRARLLKVRGPGLSLRKCNHHCADGYPTPPERSMAFMGSRLQLVAGLGLLTWVAACGSDPSSGAPCPGGNGEFGPSHCAYVEGRITRAGVPVAAAGIRVEGNLGPTRPGYKSSSTPAKQQRAQEWRPTTVCWSS